MRLIAYIRHHPLATYFAIAYASAWAAFFVVSGVRLARHETLRPTDALLIFPILILAVALDGIVLTRIVGGRKGLRDLADRMRRWKVSPRWYAVPLIPPSLILAVLCVLRLTVSPVFTPNFFPLGILFGLAPGFLEEIGWTGFAFPRMEAKYGPLTAGVLLGVLWGLWHAPVVDSLGAASPHGAFWLPFFLAFIALVAAIRVLIVWTYVNTRSVLVAQLIHASSTGSLVVFGAAHTTPAQETLWYAIYAAALWLVVAAVVAVSGNRLVHVQKPVQASPESSAN